MVAQGFLAIACDRADEIARCPSTTKAREAMECLSVNLSDALEELQTLGKLIGATESLLEDGTL